MKGKKLYDQIKIGKFIQERRKNIGITQSELAEKLHITDRAVSKWENGICIPDVSNIMELCKLLDITINDLYSGKIVDMKDNKKLLEKNLLEMAKIKEEKDKQLLSLELIIGYMSSITFTIFIFIASYIEMELWIKILLITIGIIILGFGIYNCLKIEQTIGYYKCDKCGYKYTPTYNSVFLSMHFGRTRYMKCPKSNKRSWQKKIVSK